MKAIVQRTYGTPKVLELEDVSVPSVSDDEILVRVRAASVNPYDWHQVTGRPFVMRLQGGMRRPRSQATGLDLAGQVAAVGRNVTDFLPGDDVFGMRSGAFAEYVVVSEERVVRKPANVTFEQAAAVPLAALTALQALRDKGQIQAGQKVLINGASGGVGSFALQLAKVFGAEVTGVCRTSNVDMVRSLGADHVIDYTREDFTRTGQCYDLIIDSPGNRSVSDRRRALTPQGTLVLVGGPKKNRFLGPLAAMLKMLVAARFGSQRMVGMLTRVNKEDLSFLAELLEKGQLTPMIEWVHPLHEVPQAIAEVGAGHTRGKIVIIVAGS